MRCINDGPNLNADRSFAERMLNIAPHFDLKNVNKSLKEFDIFFEVNCIERDSTKFLILQGKLPWATMLQFGEQFPNCGGNLNILVNFLKANVPQISPSMNFCQNIGKFGEGSLFRDMHHSALMASNLEKDELFKLFCFIFTDSSKRTLVNDYMDLTSQQFVNKLSKNWDKTQNTSLGKQHNFQPPATNQSSHQQNFSPRPYHNLCYYHNTYGNNANKCTGPPCEKAWMLAERKNITKPQNPLTFNESTKNSQPQV